MNPMLLGILDVIKNLLTIIPKLLYFIVSCILSLIDLCQMAFRKLAGLDSITIAGESYTGDSVYKLITDALFTNKYPAIRTIFWALIILGVFMLFVTSIVALIRLEYNPDKEKGNSKAGVVKNFFKAIFSFAIVPIACLVGMFLFNALVGVVNTVTSTPASASTEISTYYGKWNAVEDSNKGSALYSSSDLNKLESTYMAYEIFGLHIPTTTEPFSGIIFKACAYGSNRIRNNEQYYELLKADDTLGFLGKINNQESAANIIDAGFSANAKLKETTTLKTSLLEEFYPDCNLIVNIGTWQYKNITSLSKYNVNAVYYFYDLWTFNYIIAFVAVITIGKKYFDFLLYLMQRFFEVLGLFVVSPISVSLMPLDNGKSLGEWRGAFISKFTTLVVLVGTLNLISPLINICQNIKFFNIGFIDYLLTTFFLIAAFNAVDSLNKIFSKLFYADYDSVGNAAGSISKSFVSGTNSALGAAKLAAKPVTIPAKWAGRGVMAGVRAGARGIANHKQNKRKDVIDKRIKAANTAYDSEVELYDNAENTWNNAQTVNQQELSDIEADQETLNQFNNTTTGFMERNQKNDNEMIKEYKKTHFVGKKNSSQEVQDFYNRLQTDSVFRQSIIDAGYKKRDDALIDSFYQYDNSLDKAQNANRKAKMEAMLRAGQAGLDARRNQNTFDANNIKNQMSILKTQRAQALETAENRRKEELEKIEKYRNAPARRRAAAGGMIKKVGRDFGGTANSVKRLGMSLPLSHEISEILNANRRPPKQ